MLTNRTSEEPTPLKSRPTATMWKITGKIPDPSKLWSAKEYNISNMNHSKFAKSGVTIRNNATLLSRQQKALKDVQRKKESLEFALETLSSSDREKSVKSLKAEKFKNPGHKRKLVKEFFPSPNVPEAAEYGLSHFIHKPDRALEMRDLPQPDWFALKVF